MKSLEHIIEQMRNTAQISRIHSKGATINAIAELSATYADLFEGYIKDLEHANQMIDLQSSVKITNNREPIQLQKQDPVEDYDWDLLRY